MKLSSTLLQAIALGIAVSSASSSCQQNDVNSVKTKAKGIKNTSAGSVSKEKEMKDTSTSSASKEKKDSTETPVLPVEKHEKSPDSCPACGMG